MTRIDDRISEGLTRERLGLELRRAARPFLVLVVLAILAAICLAFLANRLQIALPGQEQPELRVAVDDASGVAPGNHEVRISGVVVGKITEVDLEDGQAVLTASLAPGYGPIYRDARLRLRPRTPLEDMYLNVEDRGTPEGGRLAPETVLDAERTKTPVHIREVLDVFDGEARAGLERTIDNLGEALGDRGPDFRAALVELAPFLRNARRLTHEYAIRADRTRALVHNFRLITEELARRDEQLTTLAHGGGETFTELGQVDQPIGALIQGLPATLEQLPRTFDTVRAAANGLDRAATALHPATQALPRAMTALEHLGPELDDAASALRRPLRPLTELTSDLRPTVRRVGAAFDQLEPQTPRLDRIARALPPCELAIRKFFAHTMSLSKYYDAYGVRPRGELVLSTKGATAGTIPDLGMTSEPSCAKGGPRK